jgi:two-component system sensor histidine kinase ArlS
MKIRTKLTLLYTGITALILLLFAVIIFFSAANNREKEFFDLLRKEAVTKANLFFDAQVDESTLQNIYRKNREVLNEVEVAIYNTNFELLYHDAVDIDFVKETNDMLLAILEQEELIFYQDDWQVVGLSFLFNGVNYIITAAAYDGYGFKKLDNLLATIFWTFSSSIIFIFLIGRFIADRALYPIKEMVFKVNRISAQKLNLRLKITKSKDELNELAQTFNHMLDRLEKSFNAQKHFVSNISHELRTPLAAMITELELALEDKNNPEGNIEAMLKTLDDAKKLVKLSNSLLDLAKASYDPSEIARKEIRIDEIILDASRLVQKANKNYKIDLNFDDLLASGNELFVHGNEYLLTLAFSNVIENACKYANDRTCTVRISAKKDQAIVNFDDNGIGISPEDLPHIFEPFYRGQNRFFSEGNGIGMFLVKKIIDNHSGNIQVTSELEKGTSVQINLKRSFP